jgi:glycosyltransferase involved in cell wall biosynthesis
MSIATLPECAPQTVLLGETPAFAGRAWDAPESDGPEVLLSVVMPCLNEAETLERCIRTAQRSLRELGICGEVVVADNGSTDGSVEIAERAGARVVRVAARGYGAALLGGIEAARGEYVVMADADASYDFAEIPRLLERLREGQELVMGNRFRGQIKPGAMPTLHRYLGNPLLSGLGRLFFGSPCGDFHCGLRGFRRDAILELDLRTTGMEFASEMVVRASLAGLRITEVPITLWPDGRSRPPHLRSFRDGWRHLRFLLIYSPRWLFLYPGLTLMLLGLAAMLWLMPGPRIVGRLGLDVHSLLYAAAAILVGFQAVQFAVLAQVFAVASGLASWPPKYRRLFRWMTLETGLAAGVLLIGAGLAGSFAALGLWGRTSFGALEPARMLRLVIPSVLAAVLGCQVVLSSFLLSMLGMNRR